MLENVSYTVPDCFKAVPFRGFRLPVSHHPGASRQKVENDYKFTDAFAFCKKKKKAIRE